jgi:hypothetical protein
MRRVYALVMGAALLLAATVAQGQTQVVGEWIVSNDYDRFTHGANIAATTVQNGASLTVRCHNSRLSLILSEGRRYPPLMIPVHFRANGGLIVQTAALPLDHHLLDVARADEIVRRLFVADQVAFRVTHSTIAIDRVFYVPRAAEALRLVMRHCAF